MNFLNGITLLLLYQLIGEVVTMGLHLPVPGPVVGMALLFLTLLYRRRIPNAVDSASEALLSHLSLLFVPAGVGLMTHFERIANEWLSIVLTLLLSTVVTLAATVAIMSSLQHWFFSGVSKDV